MPRYLRFLVVFISFALVSEVCYASWLFEKGEDPMTDEVFGFMAAQEQSGGYGGFLLMTKCWKAQPEQSLLTVITPAPYDNAATYKDEFAVDLRVDKGGVRRLKFAPRDMNGKIGFVWSELILPDYLEILKDISKAKKQIVVSVLGQMHIFSARGSTKSVKSLIETCGLRNSGKAVKSTGALEGLVDNKAEVKIDKKWTEMSKFNFSRGFNSIIPDYATDIRLIISKCDGDVKTVCSMDFGRGDVAGTFTLNRETSKSESIMIMAGGGSDPQVTVMKMLAVWKSIIDVVEADQPNKARQKMAADFVKALSGGKGLKKVTKNASYSIVMPSGMGIWLTVEALK